MSPLVAMSMPGTGYDVLAPAVLRLYVESRGRFDLVVLRPPRIAGLLAATAPGDAASTELLLAAEKFLEGCRSGAILCLHCPRALTRNPAAVLLLHASAGAREALAFGVCRACAGEKNDRELSAFVIAALQPMFPDLRELAPPGVRSRSNPK
jgi:hypothetical protein